MSNGHRIVLVTGPPLNGRDEYISKAFKELDLAGKVGYYHLFDYMRLVAIENYNINLTRVNVVNLNPNLLVRIRSEAIDRVRKSIAESEFDVVIVSTPSKFILKPSPMAPSGAIYGFSVDDLSSISPSIVVIFIDDLLKVHQRFLMDGEWPNRIDISLGLLATWRRESIEYVYNTVARKDKEFESKTDVVIFAYAHDYETFIDLIYGSKPRIYLSYHIKDTPEDVREKLVEKAKGFLNTYYVCIDPYTIRDWNIVEAYDNALENSLDKVYVDGYELDFDEVENAIEEIRAQIVDRDYKIILSSHATVVLHFLDRPSYGVMSEIIFSRLEANNPVYVLYPFKKRPSPFFEFYVGRENIISGDGRDLDELLDKLVVKMGSDIEKGLWHKWLSK